MAGPDHGDPAPDFELPATGGRTYRLSDLRGRPVVLVFYPGDFTPVCTRQLCSYRDDENLASVDAEVLGISPQSVETHERFREQHGLTIPLLADRDKEVARAYGVLNRLGQVKRSVFVIDADGVIRHRKLAAMMGLAYDSAGEITAAIARVG